MKLLEFYKDFRVYMRGSSQYYKYEALYELVPKPDRKQIVKQDLEDYVSKLQAKYPDRNFYLRTVKVDGRTFYVISRSSYMKLQDGSKRRVYDRISVYFDLESQKVYVPRWYIKNRRKLTNYILMRVLGSLGYASVEYRGMIR